MLKGDEELTLQDDGDGRHQTITVREVRACQAEYSGIIGMLGNIESGLITISIGEYRALPKPFLQAWNIFKIELDEFRNRNKGH